MRATTMLLDDLRSRLGRGRDNAVPASVLAADLAVGERTIQQLVSELIAKGELIGSSCTAGSNGFFLIQDFDDLDEGTRHIRARALACLQRVRTLRRAAEARFNAYEVGRLFDLDREVVTP